VDGKEKSRGNPRRRRIIRRGERKRGEIEVQSAEYGVVKPLPASLATVAE
jgi:hypothetical protein